MVIPSGTGSVAGAATGGSDDVTADVAAPDTRPDVVDGRSARRIRNREGVIQALIALIDEGDLDPSIDKIADRAAVSSRSIFRYFTDLSDLARTAIETEMAEFYTLGHIHAIGKGSFAERVEKLLASRIRVLTRTWRMARIAYSKSIQMPELDEGLASGARLMREQIQRNFAAEFEPLDDITTQSLLDALSTALDQTAYDIQRRHLGRSDEEILASWRLLLHRTLG